MNQLELGRRERIRRAARTGSAIARIYLGYKGLHLLDRGPLQPLVGAARKRWDRLSAHALNQAAIELGGVLLKAGQFLSTRADVLPAAYIERLARLQDRARPQPYTDVRRVICEELGAPPEELFARIWRRPIASASLAQVHRATLHDGREVAVKVQRPDVRAALSADLSTLRVAVRAIEGRRGVARLRAAARPARGEPRARARLRARGGQRRAHGARTSRARRSCASRKSCPSSPARACSSRSTCPGSASPTARGCAVRGSSRRSWSTRCSARTRPRCSGTGSSTATRTRGTCWCCPARPASSRSASSTSGSCRRCPRAFARARSRWCARVVARDAAGVAAALHALGIATRDPSARTIERMAEQTRRAPGAARRARLGRGGGARGSGRGADGAAARGSARDRAGAPVPAGPGAGSPGRASPRSWARAPTWRRRSCPSCSPPGRRPR